MSYFDYDMDLNAIMVLASGEYMSKKAYEKVLQDLEEKEGKVFTIPELSKLIKVNQDTIHSYINLHYVKVFRIRHYKTQRNVTLISQDEALKIIAQRTACLPMLKALNEMHGLGNMTVAD